MRSAISTFSLHRARSLADALRVLRSAPETVPIAGCTDVYVALEFGVPPGVRYLDLWPLAPLRRITKHGDVLSIGALATYTSIIRSRLVRARLPMLVAAAREIGGPQIQNRGTIGGNIANASPAGDTLPVLAAADAVVVLRSVDRERRVPFTAFYTGYRTSVRKPDELVVAVEVPAVTGAQWFRKIGTRAAQAISKVVMAGVRSAAPRLAFGSVAATVVRASRTEDALAGGATLDDAARVLAGELAPIDDLRSTAEYRRSVAVGLLRSFWEQTA
ncbi:MAG: FAD binding domain-containing protein [Gemmatimonadales bacterium]